MKVLQEKTFTVCTGYPEAYFARLPLPTDAVMAVVSACRTDDIYNQARFTRPSIISATHCMDLLRSLFSPSQRMQEACMNVSAFWRGSHAVL